MIKYPQFAKVGNKKYKINTDFRIALKCNEVAQSNISDEERGLALIYLLFGENGLNDTQNWNELLSIGLKYLKCGKSENDIDKEEANMSFVQDKGYIEASFFSDYRIDLSKTKMHWWQFYELLGGLTENCVLNRVRFVRDFDISQIKDVKEKEKWIKQKQLVALQKEKTMEEMHLDQLFEKQLQKKR